MLGGAGSDSSWGFTWGTAWFLPDLLLILAIAAMLLGEVAYRNEQRRLIGPIVYSVLAVSWVSAWVGPWDSVPVLGALVVDGLSRWFRILGAALGVFATGRLLESKLLSGRKRTEGVVYVALLVVALDVQASARDFLIAGAAFVVAWMAGSFLVALSTDRRHVLELALKRWVGLGIIVVSLSALVLGALLLSTVSSLSELPLRAEGGGALVLAAGVLFVLLLLGVYPFHGRHPDILTAASAQTGFPVLIFGSLSGFAWMARAAEQMLAAPTDLIRASPHWNGMAEFLLILLSFSLVVSHLVALRQKHFGRAVGHLWNGWMAWQTIWILVLGKQHSGMWMLATISGLCGAGAIWWAESYKDENGDSRFSRAMALAGLACWMGLPPFPGAGLRWALIQGAFVGPRPWVAVVLLLGWVQAWFVFSRLALMRVGQGHVPSRTMNWGQWLSGALVWAPVLLAVFASDSLSVWIARTIPRFFW